MTSPTQTQIVKNLKKRKKEKKNYTDKEKI